MCFDLLSRRLAGHLEGPALRTDLAFLKAVLGTEALETGGEGAGASGPAASAGPPPSGSAWTEDRLAAYSAVCGPILFGGGPPAGPGFGLLSATVTRPGPAGADLIGNMPLVRPRLATLPIGEGLFVPLSEAGAAPGGRSRPAADLPAAGPGPSLLKRSASSSLAGAHALPPGSASSVPSSFLAFFLLVLYPFDFSNGCPPPCDLHP